MVVGFLIHSLDETQITYFSYFFSAHLNDEHSIKRQNLIISQVYQNYDKKLQSFNILQTNIENNYSKQLMEKSVGVGVFRVPESSLFQKPKVVVWKKVLNLCYTLILSPEENRMAAQHFLKFFIQLLNEHFKNNTVSSKPKLLLTKPEEVLILIEKTIPNGNLIYANSFVVKNLRTEIEATILNKKKNLKDLEIKKAIKK
ncbi:ap-5 complex subunit sigma-1 [Anaeramoeba flamelloides]|uniref:Ap-5 complex subunit sigma-1 n=1 Tax=Anaeramoeba flamelloides TaxID=1746091 RepID=A0AAV7YB54_9EUKA|nr:ap-5 complex subunit sigma-1 [Anaeramoeba flamelloides]